jgi:hypothetical protein
MTRHSARSFSSDTPISSTSCPPERAATAANAVWLRGRARPTLPGMHSRARPAVRLRSHGGAVPCAVAAAGADPFAQKNSRARHAVPQATGSAVARRFERGRRPKCRAAAAAARRPANMGARRKGEKPRKKWLHSLRVSIAI